MPRLRKAINKKKRTEKELDEALAQGRPLDSDEQAQVIKNFEEAIPLNPRRPENSSDQLLIIFLKAVEVAFIAVNLVYISVPYYRTQRPLLSFLSCLSILCSALMIYTEFIHYTETTQILDQCPNSTIMLVNAFLSLILIIIPCVDNFHWPEDIMYAIPFLVAIVVVASWSERENMGQEVEDLKKYQYHYKDA